MAKNKPQENIDWLLGRNVALSTAVAEAAKTVTKSDLPLEDRIATADEVRQWSEQITSNARQIHQLLTMAKRTKEREDAMAKRQKEAANG